MSNSVAFGTFTVITSYGCLYLNYYIILKGNFMPRGQMLPCLLPPHPKSSQSPSVDFPILYTSYQGNHRTCGPESDFFLLADLLSSSSL